MSALGRLALSLGAASCALLAGCTGNSGGAAPRVMPIPLQQTEGGMMFSVDIGDFVVDPTNQGVTYAVVSGGGSFTNSVYSNMFDTIGSYPVVFDVSNAQSTTTDAFEVEVRTANLAVVRVDGQSLRLLDTDTGRFVIASAATKTETFETGLERGQLVYERQSGTTVDLYVFDTAERRTWTLGESKTLDERFEVTTEEGYVVFTRGTASDTDLLIWNPWTTLIKAISATPGEHDRNAVVNSENLVFFERGTAGQSDIWVYDPATDRATVVSQDPNSESLIAALDDGTVVFSRVGGGGESDLFAYRTAGGIFELGTDLGPVIGAQNKSFCGETASGRIVFTSEASPTSRSLWFWNAGATSAIDADENLTWRAIGGDVVAYTIDVGGQDDVFCFDVVNDIPGSPVTVSADSADERVDAVTTKNGSRWVVYTRDAGPDSVHVYDVATPGTVDLANGAGVEFRGVLPNGDAVHRIADGSEVFHFDPATGTSTSVTSGLTGTAMDFAGAGSEPGDLLVTVTTSAQLDLYLWDHSAGERVTVGEPLGDDVFQSMTAAGSVLFTRVVPGNSNADLFDFQPAASVRTRLTDADEIGLYHYHEVVVRYSADRR